MTSQPQKLLPVVVFFQGSCFAEGWSPDGTEFLSIMKGSVVDVAPNIRASALGFASDRNFALDDAVAVLKWVRDHIKQV